MAASMWGATSTMFQPHGSFDSLLSFRLFHQYRRSTEAQLGTSFNMSDSEAEDPQLAESGKVSASRNHVLTTS